MSFQYHIRLTSLPCFDDVDGGWFGSSGCWEVAFETCTVRLVPHTYPDAVSTTPLAAPLVPHVTSARETGTSGRHSDSQNDDEEEVFQKHLQ